MSTPEHPFAEQTNPYAAPALEAHQEGNSLVTPRLLQLLAKTRPWVLFLSILGFLGSALMVMGGVFGGVYGAFGQRAASGMAVMVFGVYLVMGVLYGIPSYFLLRYALRIGEFLRDATPERLVAALEAQTSFWRFLGILVAAIMVLYCVAVAGAFGFSVLWSVRPG